MKKYAILLIVIVATFGTLSATFDRYSPAFQEQPIELEREGNDSFFKHDGAGCLYGAEA